MKKKPSAKHTPAEPRNTHFFAAESALGFSCTCNGAKFTFANSRNETGPNETLDWQQ